MKTAFGHSQSGQGWSADVQGSSRPPAAGAHTPPGPPGIRPMVVAPLPKDSRQQAAALHQERDRARRPAPATKAKAKGSTALAVFVLLVIVIFASGIGAQILDAIMGLFNR